MEWELSSSKEPVLDESLQYHWAKILRQVHKRGDVRAVPGVEHRQQDAYCSN